MTAPTATAQTIQNIPLNQLVAWDGNVRKTRSKSHVAEIKASIKHDGLQQNLVVFPDGKKFAIAAGQTRFEAMQELAEEGHLPKDFAVPVIFTTKEEAHAVSLAENTIRENMNAADEAEAFAKLAGEGTSNLEIGQRYGRTERYVDQRLKIAGCSKLCLKEYRAGNLTLDQLYALTVAKDHKAQDEVVKRITGKGYFDRDPDSIREMLQPEDAVDTDDIRFKIVSEKDAIAAGVVIAQNDLFPVDGKEAKGIVQNPELLDKLVMEKLEKKLASVQKEGLLWNEIHVPFPYEHKSSFMELEPDLKPLPPKKQAERDELQKELDAVTKKWNAIELGDDENLEFDELDSQKDKLEQDINDLDEERDEFWSPEKLAVSGCVVHIEASGITVTRGLVKPEQKLAARRLIANNDGELETDDTPEKKKPKAEFSQGLVESLTAQRSAAMTAVLMDKPKEAHIALYYTLICQVFFNGASAENVLQLSATQEYFREVKGSKALEEIEARQKELKKKLPAKPKLWDWIQQAKNAKTLQLVVSFCISVTVDCLQKKLDNPKGARLNSAQQLADLIGLDMTKWFKATAANYFSKVNKTQMLEALKDVNATMPGNDMKAAEVAKYAEQQTATKNWLPKLLRSK
jgi:ParB family chromosome partitioning protein